MKINLSKVLRPWQKDYMENKKRFNVLVVHRRWGKTVGAILDEVICMVSKWVHDYWYIAPTYKQAKKIAWRIIRKFWDQIWGFVYNSSELMVTFESWATLSLFGAENPDSLRWLDLYGVIFDEYAQQPSRIYWEIIFPMINANRWWVTWIGTPKWKNAFFKLYQRALKNDKYYTALLRYSDTNLLDDEQIQDAREEMTEEEFLQEYECSWDAQLKWSIYWKDLSQAYKEWRIKKWLYDPSLPVTTFWDLWMSDAMAIWFIQTVWPEIRIIDRYTNSWFWFEHYTNKMIEKWYRYNKHYFPHDIANRELATWTSRLETVKKLLWPECYMVPMNTIESWISAWRLIFKYLYIDDDLEDFINNLSLYQYEYDDKLWEFKKSPKHDFTSHDADWFRYMATIYRALTTSPKPQKIWVVNNSRFR